MAHLHRLQLSQLTAVLVNSGTRWVLRRKPSGPLISPTAHQVEREYTMLVALHKYNARADTLFERKVSPSMKSWPALIQVTGSDTRTNRSLRR